MTVAHSAQIWKVADAVSGNDGGPEFPLGFEVRVPGSAVDKTLYYVTSAGVVAGGPSYDPASTDVAVTLPANTGDQVWIYVYNDSGATLERGNVCAAKSATIEKRVRKAPAGTPSSMVVGVAQHDIATGKYGFILREGVGEVLAGTETIDVDEGLVVSDTDAGTAGNEDITYTDSGAATVVINRLETFGWAIENAAAAALATCVLKCKG